MAIPSAAVFEWRSTGTATAGGFYNPSGASPGTDYSQQNSPQVSVTDAVANGTTTVTSATAGFSSAHNRNGVYINGAWYEITAVTNSTTIVVDRTITSASGLTLNVGGAMDHPATAASAYVAGNTAHFKSGTYLHGTTANASGGRLNLAVGISVYGYTTTRGDGAPTRPIVQANGSSITLWTISNLGTAAPCRVFDVDFYRDTSSGFTAVVGLSTGQQAEVVRCRCRNMNPSGASSGGFIQTSTTGATYRECESDGCTTGFFIAVGGTTLTRCVARNSTTHYGFLSTATCTLVDCIGIDSNISDFFISNACTLDHCTSYSATSHGFDTSATVPVRAIGCLAVGSGGYGFRGLYSLSGCAGHGNSTANYDAASVARSENFVACSAAPLANPAGGDYSPNDVAGGGAAIKAISVTLPGLSTVTRRDIGAVQSAPATPTAPIYRRRIRPLGV